MNVRFVGSFKSDFLKDKPHVVFVGRSNVGKSSLINMLVNRKIAYVSKVPGKTRFINLFELERKIYLADAPGYGFAKVSKEEQESWKKLMESYFFDCKDVISNVFLLIDSVVGPTELDKMMIDWLEYVSYSHLYRWELPASTSAFALSAGVTSDRPSPTSELLYTETKHLSNVKFKVIVVLTKIDKASQKEVERTLDKLKSLTNAPILLTSSKEGRGRKELLSLVFAESKSF